MPIRQNQIAIIGMGVFGIGLAQALMKSGVPVCAVDSDPAIVETIKDQVTTAVIMDTTQEKALREAEIDRMDVAIVAIGEDNLENSIMTTALLKQLGVKTIIARSCNPLHERILHQVGATRVINPEQDIGERLARQLIRPGLQELLELPGQACIARVPVPRPFVGKTLEQLAVRKNYGVNVLGIEHPSVKTAAAEQWNDLAHADIAIDIDPATDRLAVGDYLLVMGYHERVNRLLEL